MSEKETPVSELSLETWCCTMLSCRLPTVPNNPMAVRHKASLSHLAKQTEVQTDPTMSGKHLLGTFIQARLHAHCWRQITDR
jgi:hypothetical protein